MTIRILLVGGGGREHAIAQALCKSVHEPHIYCFSELTNPGINALVKKSGGEYSNGNPNDPKSVVQTALYSHVDFAFIGPEEPNFHGVPDALEKAGIHCIGARRSVAELELSKASMRDLQWKYRIPGRLWYKKFKTFEEAAPYIEEFADSVALKPARQAGGKGVKVIEDFQVYLQDDKRKVKREHAESIVNEYMKGYDDIDYKLLIEERVWGPEYTVHCFTDGRTVLPMPAVQDNKHAFEGDLGLETGGMGSISCGRNLRWGIDPDDERAILTDSEYDRSVEIVRMMIDSIQKDTGEKYHGVVAGQMMLTSVWGPTVIEMYSRLGDPEAANVLSSLKTDLVDICEAIIGERLNTVKAEFDDSAVVVKAVCPEGYPNRRDLASGHPVYVNGTERGILWASANCEGEKVVTGGSRAVECVGKGDTIPEASRSAEKLVAKISLEDGWKLFHRSDIGSEKSMERRISLGSMAREIYEYRERKGLLGKRMLWIPGKGLVEVG
jgi:phosphoribosylamine--glycine ligase